MNPCQREGESQYTRLFVTSKPRFDKCSAFGIAPSVRLQQFHNTHEYFKRGKKRANIGSGGSVILSGTKWTWGLRYYWHCGVHLANLFALDKQIIAHL